MLLPLWLWSILIYEQLPTPEGSNSLRLTGRLLSKVVVLGNIRDDAAEAVAAVDNAALER